MKIAEIRFEIRFEFRIEIRYEIRFEIQDSIRFEIQFEFRIEMETEFVCLFILGYPSSRCREDTHAVGTHKVSYCIESM